MVGGYVWLDEKLYAKAISLLPDVEVDGSTGFQYNGAYEYFRNLYKAGKPLVIPQLRTNEGGTSPISFVVMHERIEDDNISYTVVDGLNPFSMSVNEKYKDVIIIASN